MGPSAIIKADQNVVSTELGGGSALLNLETSRYFSLDDVGSFIWQQLESPKTLQDIINAVADNFEVELAVCSSDVTVFIQSLRDASLVDVTDEGLA
jgi:DNA-directed RNA polymerase delta subunit